MVLWPAHLETDTLQVLGCDEVSSLAENFALKQKEDHWNYRLMVKADVSGGQISLILCPQDILNAWKRHL